MQNQQTDNKQQEVVMQQQQNIQGTTGIIPEVKKVSAAEIQPSQKAVNSDDADDVEKAFENAL